MTRIEWDVIQALQERPEQLEGEKSPFWRNHQAERSVSAPCEGRPLNVSLGSSADAIVPVANPRTMSQDLFLDARLDSQDASRFSR